MVWLLAAAVGSVTPAAAQDSDGPPPVAEVVAIVGFTNLGRDPGPGLPSRFPSSMMLSARKRRRS